ncbi:sigma-70 family RNA polymerase sigma factor [Sphaerotilus sp.]|uniref:sigma-70 family RNA polymerase sigma factor n=1 Tax=Sphaerotilus sp. TaxID=2093942 RepID=UPI002ACDAA0E|nr:sigma-70 family RNA polymerase sigma factor [Sphaerotilus sp.]MDZ7855856.1 sigma-70 family RNA polymerase sigma factor [Sphaerotilus sp.]
MSATESVFQQHVQSLYSDHHGWLHSWLRRKLGCTHQAADLAHDTFVRLLAKREALALDDLREPRAYLTTVARGLVFNHHRRQKLEQAWGETLSALPEAMAPSAETRAILLETLVEIARLLDTLKPKVREAFLLSQLDGLTYQQIGERLGVGERMVKKYMAQAMLCCLQAGDGPQGGAAGAQTDGR